MGKFVHRVGGAEIPRFGGVRRECDPGAIPPNMFRNAVNVRYQGGRLVSRGGQSKFNASALLGRVQGFFCGEHQFVEAVPPATCFEVGLGGAGAIDGPRLYILAVHVVSAVYQQGFFYFSKDQDPVLRLASYGPRPANKATTVIAPYGVAGALIGGGSGGILELKQMTRGGVPQLLASASTGYSAPTAIAIYGGVPYLCVADTATWGARIYKYNSVTHLLELDDSPGATSASGWGILVVSGSDLYWLHNIGAAVGHVRRKSGGAWTSLTTNPPFTIEERPAAAADYGGAVYFITVRGGVGKIAGATVSKPHTLGPYDGSVSLANSRLAVFNGYLYYLWPDAVGAAMVVGRFNGTTWDDVHKSLTAQFPDVHNLRTPWFFGEVEGNLVLAVEDRTSPATCVINLFSSPGTATGGTWVSHAAHHDNLKQYGASTEDWGNDVGCVF